MKDYTPPDITQGWGEEWKDEARECLGWWVEKYRQDGETDARTRELVIGVVRDGMKQVFPDQETNTTAAMMAETYMSVIQNELAVMGL